LLYGSSRGQEGEFTSAQVIKQGIASDGGLFVPDHFPVLAESDWVRLQNMDYKERAFFILKLYLDDYPDQELAKCVDLAYDFQPDELRDPSGALKNSFDHPRIAPLHQLSDLCYVQELWHGPTGAFKDMALRILPRLMTASIRLTEEKSRIVILTATSGDTGKAALAGFRDVPGTSILVYYPKKGVSRIQEWQMITQPGHNVKVVAVNGNFDDTQRGVKDIFADINLTEELNKKRFKLSSANSINWGRLAPQIVYYISAYADLLNDKALSWGDSINIVVPTGNFGNILAAYYAGKMGLPIKKLICAANSNNVLTDFINTGHYNRNRPFYQTMSPSMDILISSNLERLLYEINGRDHERLKSWMRSLSENGAYSINEELKKTLRETFWSAYCNEEETASAIKYVWDKYNYLIDPHTAVGFNVYQKYRRAAGDTDTVTLLISTASPYKFSGSVAQSVMNIDSYATDDEFKLAARLEKITNKKIPRSLRDLSKYPVLHHETCEQDNMEEPLRSWLKIVPDKG
jgi:threonine synthase